MSLPEQRMTHVTPVEYLAASRQLDEEIIRTGSVDGALTRHIKKASSYFSQVMSGVSGAMVSVDRSTGDSDEYDQKLTRYAVLTGAVAGLAVAKVAYVPERFSSGTMFNALEIDITAGEDDMQYLHEQSSELRAIGWDGIRTIGEEAASLFESWEEKIIPDVTKQSLFRVGAGIVFVAAHHNFDEILKQRLDDDRAAFSLQVSQSESFDWDAALKDL